MTITIQVRYRYQIREASPQTCEQFNKPAGSWEVFDTNGFRLCFAKSEQDAVDQIADYVYGDIDHMDFELIKEKNDE